MHTLWFTTFTYKYKRNLPSLPQLFGTCSRNRQTTNPGAGWQSGLVRERARSILDTGPAMAISTNVLISHVDGCFLPEPNSIYTFCTAATFTSKPGASIYVNTHSRSNVFYPCNATTGTSHEQSRFHTSRFVCDFRRADSRLCLFRSRRSTCLPFNRRQPCNVGGDEEHRCCHSNYLHPHPNSRAITHRWSVSRQPIY